MRAPESGSSFPTRRTPPQPGIPAGIPPVEAVRRSKGWLALPLLAALGCGGPGDAPAGSGPGSTDIFLAELRSEDGLVWAGPPIRVTDRDGYDDQPAFSEDGSRLFFSSRRGSQADIFAFELEDGRVRRLTRTLESEYSPAAIPGDARFSAVRVERDGRQRIWAFGGPADLGELLVPRPDYVGYLAWADRDTLAVFVMGRPPTLHRVDLDGGVSDVLAGDIGRCLQRIPGRRAVSFVTQHDDDGVWWIHELDLASGRHRPLVATLPGAEHHAWLPGGDLLMAQDSAILRWGPDTLGLWAEVADYADEDIRSITRLAVDPGGRLLAFVAGH